MATKKELLTQEVAKAVGAGKSVALDTVDFSDPNRPKTCLEVDFPLVSVNEVAGLEASSGALKKPIYQMSKWWARRQSSVFRAMLIAAATKAPDDKSHAAKMVWDNYYANHQKKGAFKNLKVADIFMGGGTTLVEGSRLGMQMFGNDLNPVAWFIVKQELAKIDLEEVQSLLDDIEAEVKPQIMPYYYCNGPNGEKGKWTHVQTKRVMGPEFDPLDLTPEQRRDYSYEGPEIIYTFWAKHGPCQVTGCGHRTPIMTSTVTAVKTLSVKHWEHRCDKCGGDFHVEEKLVRMAPGVPFFVTADEYPFSILDQRRGVVCPHCNYSDLVKLGKSKNKKVELSLLVHPQWLAGSPKQTTDNQAFGGTAQDDAVSTARWSVERASKIRLLEVRGTLPREVTCPETRVTFKPGKDGGTVPKKSNYACGACGTVQDVLTTVKASGKTGPMAAYMIQGYTPSKQHASGIQSNGSRFFSAFDKFFAHQYAAAAVEWDDRKDADLADYWPRSELPYGFMTHHLQGGVPNHGHTHWWTMFNPRQLLVNALLLKAICTVGGSTHKQETREFVLGAFQQFIRCNTTLSIWHMRNSQISAALSNSNFHPKSTSLEPSVFGLTGDGNWKSAVGGLINACNWKVSPWELVCNDFVERVRPELSKELSGKSEKILTGDKLADNIKIVCESSTDLSRIEVNSCDLVITDPPFGGLLHYSELSDYFYVWLRLALKDKYPEYFKHDYTPKSLEAVANRAREPENPDAFYQRLLTQCWKEAYSILKTGGILAFTFHHSEDEPWVAVLESLFDAGFYLEATYPIRSDETKGDGEYGSKTIEYDIIHVCRKRTEEPKPVSWGRMRREVLADVRQLQVMLENHAKEGLPAADLQVIRRGKALEYFSRHYGKVYVDDDRTITVKDALVGINQLIDEDVNRIQEPPPINAEPITRQFLRIFDKTVSVPRDQIQKFLRGSGVAPDEFEARAWCIEKNKVFTIVEPLDFARDWQGKHKRKLTSDLDQALVLIGACFDGSGINANDTLKNQAFKPHQALKSLLDWFGSHGATSAVRNASIRAKTILNAWQASQKKSTQLSLFDDVEWS
jgi:DNA modification methylase